MSRIRASASRPNRSTSTATQTLSTESRLTAERRGIGSERHLCAEHVVAQDDNTSLTTGEHPILLPPRLGAIMSELADRPPTRLIIHHGPDAPRWLFPGRVPGQPIDNHSLTNRLNRHRISARPARNGALMALAADLPANHR